MNNNPRILKSLYLVWRADQTNPLVKGYLKQLGVNLEPSPKLRAERLEYEVSNLNYSSTSEKLTG